MIDYKNYILWIQSKSHKSEDLLFVDGKIPSDENRQDVFSYIFPSNAKGDWIEIPIKHETKIAMGATSSLRFYKKRPKEVLITSNFVTTDLDGRKVAYMFCTHFSTMETVCESLNRVCSDLGYQCNDADLQLLQTKIKKKSNLSIPILIIVVILFVLWKIQSCQN